MNQKYPGDSEGIDVDEMGRTEQCTFLVRSVGYELDLLSRMYLPLLAS